MSEGGKDTAPSLTRRNFLAGLLAVTAAVLGGAKIHKEYRAAQKVYQQPIDEFLYTIQTGDEEGPVAIREKPSPGGRLLGRAPAQEAVELRKERGAPFPQHPNHNIEIDGKRYGVWFRGKFRTADGEIVEGYFPSVYASVIEKTPINPKTTQK